MRVATEIRGLPQQGRDSRARHLPAPPRPTARPKTPGGFPTPRCLATMKFLDDRGSSQSRIRLSQGGPFELFLPARAAKKRNYNSRAGGLHAQRVCRGPHGHARGAGQPPGRSLSGVETGI